MQISKRYYIGNLPRHDTPHGSRTTILRPLGWLVGILATLVFAGMKCETPTWMDVVIISLFALSVLLYLAAFAGCLLSDKESLRTERYTIQRLAMKFRGRTRK